MTTTITTYPLNHQNKRVVNAKTVINFDSLVQVSLAMTPNLVARVHSLTPGNEVQ